MRKQFGWGIALAATAVLFGLLVTLHGNSGRLAANQSEMFSSGSEVAASSAVAAQDGHGIGGGTGGMMNKSAVSRVAKFASAGSPANGPVASDPETAAKLTLVSMSDSQVDRYLIKNATVLVEAKDVIEAAKSAKQFAKSVNGYVSSSHETVDGLGLKNVALEVRVPATQFDAAMQSVEGLGRVLDSQITSEDVTEQYVDTDAQLRNLKKTEERLLEHLSRTGKLSDTLLIETELTRVRESLNELEGKLRFMSHRITFCTISLTFKEPAHIESIAPVESYSIGHVTSEAMRSVVGFLQSAISVGVWALVWSVLWAPLLMLGRYVYVRQRARYQAR